MSVRRASLPGVMLAFAVAAAAAELFQLSAVAGYDGVRPGEPVPVAVMLDVAPAHWAYAETVQIEIRPAGALVVHEGRPPSATHHDLETDFASEVYVGRAVFRLQNLTVTGSDIAPEESIRRMRRVR